MIMVLACCTWILGSHTSFVLPTQVTWIGRRRWVSLRGHTRCNTIIPEICVVAINRRDRQSAHIHLTYFYLRLLISIVCPSWAPYLLFRLTPNVLSRAHFAQPIFDCIFGEETGVFEGVIWTHPWNEKSNQQRSSSWLLEERKHTSVFPTLNPRKSWIQCTQECVTPQKPR